MDPYYVAGEFVGALIATFLFSRLALWLLKSWDGGAKKLVAAHITSLMAAALLAGITMSENGQFAGATALATYFVPQLVWFAVDLLRLKRSSQQAAA